MQEMAPFKGGEERREGKGHSIKMKKGNKREKTQFFLRYRASEATQQEDMVHVKSVCTWQIKTQCHLCIHR